MSGYHSNRKTQKRPQNPKKTARPLDRTTARLKNDRTTIFRFFRFFLIFRFFRFFRFFDFDDFFNFFNFSIFPIFRFFDFFDFSIFSIFWVFHFSTKYVQWTMTWIITALTMVAYLKKWRVHRLKNFFQVPYSSGISSNTQIVLLEKWFLN